MEVAAAKPDRRKLAEAGGDDGRGGPGERRPTQHAPGDESVPSGRYGDSLNITHSVRHPRVQERHQLLQEQEVDGGHKPALYDRQRRFQPRNPTLPC